MNARIISTFTFLLFSTLISAQEPEAVTATKEGKSPSPEEVNRALLKELTALRKEIAALRNDLGALKQHATTPAKPAVAPLKQVELQFACTGVLEHTSKILLPNKVELQLTKRSPSAAVKFSIQDDRIVKVYATGVLSSKAKTPIAEFTLPVGINKALILLIPNSEKSKFDSYIINDNKFKKGAITIINFTEKDIKFQPTNLNEISIPKGKHQLFQPEFTKRITIPLKMFSSSDSDWKLFYSSIITLSETRKELMILHTSGDSDRIRIKGITQF